jgi:hypothetical protein
MSNTATATFFATSLMLTVPTASTGTAASNVRDAGPGPIRTHLRPITGRVYISPSASTSNEVREDFERLVEQWELETQFLSDLDARYAHPAYQRIIEIGWTVVPFLLARLRTRPDFWFHALRAITGANPVSTRNSGRLVAMANEWIAWGHSSGVTV